LEIKLSKIIRELRLHRGNTQEELANFLGVTTQAVSKWERAEGMPDITYLPEIAGFYEVSVDTLLGVDEEAKNRHIQEITDEYNRIRRHEPHPDGTLFVDHGIDEGIALIRAAVREFPDCWFFYQLLASDLWWRAKSLDGDEKNALLHEAEDLCNAILTSCTEDRWRHCANSILCMVYIDSGRREKALENAFQSAEAVDCIDWKLTKIYEGDELKKQLRRTMREFLRLLYLSAKQMHDEGGDFEFAKNDSSMQIQLNFIRDQLHG
jgi:transcriptional regulator with XRE-family HTH domain